MAFCLPGWAESCEELANLPLPHAKISGAAVVRDRGSIAQVSQKVGDLPPFCRVDVVVTPVPDSQIRVEVWMPVEGWKGKFEGTGSGGFAGSIQYWGLADGVRRGYAVADTDMGTAPSTGEIGDALIGHPERWTDWGMRATHEMKEVSKAIVRAYYGRAQQFAYFNDCSTGGEQGLMEARCYPEDYDGIVSGAPANNRTHLDMAILWNFAMSEGPPPTRIPTSKLPMLERAVLTECAAQKAAPADASLSRDPAACHWDPQVLACKAGDGPDCLTAERVAAAKEIYAGPTDPVTHASIYPGAEPGSESGWSSFVPRDGSAPFGGVFRWVFGPQWKWRSFDFNRDVATMDARLAPVLNATDPDLSSFKRDSHKLILYDGWADWLVPSRESLLYYDSVVHANA